TQKGEKFSIVWFGFELCSKKLKLPEEPLKKKLFNPIEDKILDFVEGQEDLKNSEVRNTRERLKADKLRMLRVVHLETQLD
ncbi:513_t:CDS:1, partial [Gigaspora rosea]